MATMPACLTDDDGIVDRVCSCKRHVRDNRNILRGHTFERSLRVQELKIPICIRCHAQRHQADRTSRQRAVTIRTSGGLITLVQQQRNLCAIVYLLTRLLLAASATEGFIGLEQ